MGDVTRFRNYPQMATVKKAAEVFGVSPSYLRRLCKAGKIIFVNTGHVWLINLDSLARYFDKGDPGPAEASQNVGKIRRVEANGANWGIVLANKRMFSVDVTETDAFLEMPLTAQALYFHLGMRGDDDGFVSNPRSICGCQDAAKAIW